MFRKQPIDDWAVHAGIQSKQIKQLAKSIKRVRELHVADYDNACQVCIKGLDYDEYLPIYEEYPCPTIKALDMNQ